MKTEIEYVAYHRVKRVFIAITDIESENPEDIEVYEFEGQNFN
jgi:ribosomal protein L20A (L18A)